MEFSAILEELERALKEAAQPRDETHPSDQESLAGRLQSFVGQANRTCGGSDAQYLLRNRSTYPQAVLLAWEQLHTGNWKDVEPFWRELYSLASLLDVLRLNSTPNNTSPSDGDEEQRQRLLSAIRSLDLAVMMGGPTFRDVLDPIIESIHDALLPPAASPPPSKRPTLSLDCTPDYSRLPFRSLLEANKVPSLSAPSLEDFLSKCMMASAPTLINHCMAHWSALRKWADFGYLKSIAGFRSVPIEVGSHYLAEGWGQELMYLGDYLDQHVARPAGSTRPIAYLAQHSLFEQIPRLARDFSVPDYCCLGEQGEPHTTNVWLGPQGTVTPLHFDPDHNLLTQVVGYKYVRLYRPEDSPTLAPVTDGVCTNTSTVDLDALKDEADLERASAGLSMLPYLDCLLGPGSMLYIPPKWWHYVRSVSPSISISFWWR